MEGTGSKGECRDMVEGSKRSAPPHHPATPALVPEQPSAFDASVHEASGLGADRTHHGEGNMISA